MHEVEDGGVLRQPLGRRQGRRRVEDAAVQDPADDVVLLQHAATISSMGTPAWSRSDGRVLGERSRRFGGDADVVDDQPAGLVAEGAVDPGDGLHQPGALHRLVDVHRVHRRRVEAGEPHVADDDDLQRIVRVLRAQP